MKFRKKPVVIDAEQFNGQQIEGVCTNKDCKELRRYKDIHDYEGYILSHIHTLEGIMIVNVGDWVLTGVKGEKYPCKPDIFEQTYERVE